jgi:hypothetical protein
MAKTNTNSADSVAESNDGGQKIIAEWIGSNTSPRIKGRTERKISIKEAKDGLLMDLTRDLRWGPETAYRADVSAEPEAFQNWLREEAEFKVTEE